MVMAELLVDQPPHPLFGRSHPGKAARSSAGSSNKSELKKARTGEVLCGPSCNDRRLAGKRRLTSNAIRQERFR